MQPPTPDEPQPSSRRRDPGRDSLRTERLECPRCAHRLEGSALAAEARGEPRGICTECGLPIEWATLRRDAIAPRWFVEARRPLRSLPMRTVSTLVRSTRPMRFWSAIDLALPFRWRGYLALAVAVAAALHVVAVVAKFAPDSSFWRDFSHTRSLRPPGWESLIAADVALILLSPASNFRGRELLWAARRESGGTGFIALPLVRLFAVATVRPLADGIVSFTPGAGSTAFWINATGRRMLPTTAWPSVVASACAAVLSPFAMLLLPTSLRRARVRKVHLVRIAATGMALFVPVFALALGLDAAGATYHRFSIEPMTWWGAVNAHLFLAVGSWIAISVWIAAAAGRYLRLPNPASVGVCCAAIGMLLILHLLVVIG